MMIWAVPFFFPNHTTLNIMGCASPRMFPSGWHCTCASVMHIFTCSNYCQIPVQSHCNMYISANLNGRFYIHKSFLMFNSFSLSNFYRADRNIVHYFTVQVREKGLGECPEDLNMWGKVTVIGPQETARPDSIKTMSYLSHRAWKGIYHFCNLCAFF